MSKFNRAPINQLTGRSFVICMALFSLVATSACSRSSGGSNPPPPQAPPATTQSTIPNSQSELDPNAGKAPQETKGPQTAPPQNSSQNAPQTAPQAPPQNAPQNAPQTAPQKAPQATAPTAPQTAPQVSDDDDSSTTAPQNPTAPSSGPQIGTYDPTGLTPEQIYAASEAQGPAFVGGESNVTNGQSSEPLFFSGAGQDNLRESLQSGVDKNTRADRAQRDKTFAKNVSNGRFDVDWSSRTAVIDVVVKGANGPTVYHFTGSLDNKLKLKAGDLRHGEQISVETACMDLNGGCGTVYAKIQDGSGGTVRTAHMIIRQTPATLFTRADGFGLAQNEEFDSLLRTLVRTDHHAGERNALNSLMLRTSETINGASSYHVEMGILSNVNAQETLNLGGALVKPATEMSVNAPAEVLESSTSFAAQTIRNVALITNDGRGTLTLSITVRKTTAESQEDTMKLTIARVHKPIRPVIVK